MSFGEKVHYFYIASHISILHQLCAFEMRNLISLNNLEWKCAVLSLENAFQAPSSFLSYRFDSTLLFAFVFRREGRNC